MKEASNDIGALLQASEVGDCPCPHTILILMANLSHDSGLQIPPHPFVRIELRRVAGKKVKRDLAAESLEECFNLLRLVGGMSVDNEEDPSFGSVDEAFDEINELVGANGPLHYHKPEHALRADRRNHVESEPSPGSSDHRGLALRSPSRPGVAVGADAGLVTEVDLPVATRGFPLDGRELFLKPLVNGLRVPLVGPPQGTLSGKPKLIKQPANRGLAEFDAIFLGDEVSNHLAGPQREGESELERVAHGYGVVDPLEHLAGELRLAPAPLSRFESVPPAFAIERKPVVNGCPVDVESLGNHFGAFPALHGLHSSDSQFGELSVGELPSISVSNFSHASYCSTHCSNVPSNLDSLVYIILWKWSSSNEYN